MEIDAITTEDVQQLKSATVATSPKTVNNVLMVLSVMLRTAVEWNLMDRVPYTIKLLKAPNTTAASNDFEEYERLVEAAHADVRRRRELSCLAAQPTTELNDCRRTPPWRSQGGGGGGS